ncbi:vacuolar protein sorting-associated protein 37B-like [Branchiostoma lanceolatum]|uniref:vacuolar protein sorting-associated protein 37B-like n=1 Tax=Branchiostoma lanceolatum TaxID=7740 RepID=UPI0034562F10
MSWSQGSRGPPEANFELLNHLNREELQSMLSDDGKIWDLVNDHESVKSLQLEREMLLASNRSLAEFNLEKEPELVAGRQKLARVHQEAAELRVLYDEKKQRLESLVQRNDLDTTHALLQAAAAEIEEESESLADQFLEGGVVVEDFLSQYQEKRRLAHLRRVKSDKMQELMNRSQSAPAPQPRAYGNYAPPGGYGQPYQSQPYQPVQNQPHGILRMPEPIMQYHR